MRLLLKEGDKAPDFILKDTDGNTIHLEDYLGSSVVLYFYPRDNTPGCTKEACAFRDAMRTIKERQAIVLGVSHDNCESHKKFRDEFKLNFPLLCDIEKEISMKYGVYVPKKMHGREFMGIDRTTFLIDQDGMIKKIFKKVEVEGHVEEVLSLL